jgi:hypothetical protein
MEYHVHTHLVVRASTAAASAGHHRQ